MLVQSILSALVAAPLLASALPHQSNRRNEGLSVELSQASETKVKATVSNTGAETLHLFTSGTILDNAPVQQLDVTQNGVNVEYLGLIIDYAVEDLDEDSFVTLAPGESAEALVNIPALYAINGGDYSVSLNCEISFAGVETTQLEGVYEFQTNTLDFSIDESVAAAVPKAVSIDVNPLEKRTRLVSCSGSQLTALTNAVTATNRLSTAAANAASSGSSTKFNEYFRTTSTTTRSNVAARFRSFAAEASSTTSGSSTYSCVDFLGVCTSNTIAYAQPATGRMASCPIFWQLRAVSTGCNQQSQASTVLHEFTHILAGTVDYAYGYAASTALTAARAYANADNYALYADAIANGC
ncbi:deuterolysin metalloprotease [Diaporthe helianthi]|uniref:Neutral protease 2 n=1 Tax=Diaporthe helianthi TaxID=158607 RepID=A0A2P5I3M5_DIAHE|nr:deuterolysin metalloprotease [Diaporthe helianthi]